MRDMIQLPSSFAEKMKELLGGEYEAYLKSCGEEPRSGLRANRWKIPPDELEEKLPFGVKRVPWISNGFTYDSSAQPSRDPYYYAGLYYLQEPSAMTPASRLPVEPGDRVLDLCAAPGGKATELGAKLQGKGLLAANDISSSRARALLKNLELAGLPNIYVLSEDPEKLAARMPEFFDKVLVDAPCSGEGMFRKDPSMIRSWQERGPEYYCEIQKKLILQAADLLKPGGMLMYSTCTFDVREDEEIVAWLLKKRPKMRLIPMEGYEGFEPGRLGLTDCVRIFPQRMAGEGHFLALFAKEAADLSEVSRREAVASPAGISPEAEEFLKGCRLGVEDPVFDVKQERIYLKGKRDGMPEGLRYLRTGLYLGDCARRRFEPSQALAMTLGPDTYDSCILLKREDPRVIRYLKGETLDVSDLTPARKKGWQLVCVDGHPLGWGKLAGGMLKNKYSAGWRWQ